MSHVCQAWRVAAIHSPKLWTVLYIRLVFHHTRILQWIEVHLERLHQQLLDIYILSPSATESKERRIEPLVEMARAKQTIHCHIPHVSRWSRLTVQLAYAYAAEVLLWELQGSAESLEELTSCSVHSHGRFDLSNRETRRLEDDTRHHRIFQESFSAPKMQSLKFISVLHNEPLEPLLPLQFPALEDLMIKTSFCIDFTNPRALEFTSLQALVLHNSAPAISSAGQGMSFRNLTSLMLHSMWPKRYLPNCSMPLLSCLAISNVQVEPETPSCISDKVMPAFP